MPTPLKSEEFSLSNGIPVLLHASDGEVASIYWWNNVGSADEQQKEAGFAHFLEHMLFKDAAAKETGRASTGQLARTIESLGGDINAYTSFDQTVYHVTCAAEHFDRVIDAFAQMAKPQRFLKQDFAREREVILEELRKNEDSPGRKLFQLLLSSLFRVHPYGRPVIGTVETLKRATVASLEAFYRRHYVAGRMGIIVVAPLADDRRREAIRAKLERHFGKKAIPAGARPRAPRPAEPELRRSEVIAIEEFDVQSPTLMGAFRVPALAHEDVPALDLMAGVLGSGELSRLYQRLFYERSLVTDASAGVYIPSDPGLFYFSLELDSIDKVNEAVRETLRVFRSLEREPASEDELRRIIVNVESEKMYALQTSDGIASRIGFLKFVLGDLAFDAEYLERLRDLRAPDLARIAEKYLVPERLAIAMLVPKGQRKQVDVGALRAIVHEELAREGSRPTAAPKRTAARARPGIVLPEVITHASGIRLAYLRRPSSAVFSIQAFVPGGVRLESQWGAGNLLASVWTKGTTRHDAKAIAAVVEGSAAHLQGFSGRNSAGLQLTGLARDFDRLTPLFTEVLVDASFEEGEVAHAKRVVEDSIRSIEDHSSQLCSKLFFETLFETHPYGRWTAGSLESVAALTPAGLREEHRRWLAHGELVVSAVGNFSDQQLHEWLEALARARTEAIAGAHGTLATPAREPALRAPRWVEKSLGREQIHILIGGLGSTVASEDRHAVRLLQSVLGGQSGPLFIELREKRSLAYTVAPVHFEGIEPGYIGTYIACSPAKRDEATRGLQAVIEKVAREGGGRGLARAKQFMLGRRAMDLQSDASLASHYALALFYGHDPRDEVKLVERMKRVSASEIRSVIERYYLKPHLVTAVVG